MPAILPAHVFRDTDVLKNPATTTMPVGNGPFMLSEWVRGDHLTFVRNPNYWRAGKPYLDSLVVKIMPDSSARILALQAGEIDFVDEYYFPLSAYKLFSGDPRFDVHDVSYPSDDLIIFNTRNAPLDKPQVRQALLTALDRDYIHKNVFYDTGSIARSSIDTRIPWAYDPAVDYEKMYAYDPAKAAKLLDEAGVKPGADGVRFSVRLSFDTGRPEYTSFAQAIQRYWQAIGVKAVLEGAERPVVLKRVYADYDFDATLQNYTTSGDPALGISRLYTTESINKAATFNNASGYSNPEVDALFAKGRDAASQARACQGLLQGAGDPGARLADAHHSSTGRDRRGERQAQGPLARRKLYVVGRRMAGAVNGARRASPPARASRRASRTIGRPSDTRICRPRRSAVAKRFLLDNLGAAIAGAKSEVTLIALEAARAAAEGGAGSSVVFGRHATLPAPLAAMVNGTSAHALELDDFGGCGHSGAVVIPVVLALAARGRISGKAALAALLAGYDLAARVLEGAGGYRPHNEKGWHSTGTCGSFGAAAAAAKLLALDAERFANALGIAGTFTGGIWAFLDDGAMTKRFHPGKAAENGLTAALLAQAGMSGPRRMLEAEWGGFFSTYSPGIATPEATLAGLGKEFRIATSGMKPYACCRGLHACLDALFAMMQETGDRRLRRSPAWSCTAMRKPAANSIASSSATCSMPSSACNMRSRSAR